MNLLIPPFLPVATSIIFWLVLRKMRQFFVIPPPHPIDKKHEGRLEFLGSNQEMEQNIGEAESDWRALDLTEYISIFATQDEEGQKRSSPTPMVFFPRLKTDKK